MVFFWSLYISFLTPNKYLKAILNVSAVKMF